MKKDIIVITYNGNVQFYDFPKNFKRENIYTLVREALHVLDGKTHVDLFNVEYYTNYGLEGGLYKDLKTDNIICNEDEIDCIIDYDDYVKGEGYIQVNR